MRLFVAVETGAAIATAAGTAIEGLSDLALGTIRVEASTLFESRLSSKAPEYIALQRTVLGGRT